MAAYTLFSNESTQPPALAGTVADIVTVPTVPYGSNVDRPGQAITVSNLSGATALRVTAGAVGATLDPLGGTATIVPAGTTARVIPTGVSSALAVDVKVVGNANTYAVARGDNGTVTAVPTSTNGPLRGIAVFDPASGLTATQQTTNVPVVGAQMGDLVQVSTTATQAAVSFSGYVSAPNVVTVLINNASGATVDVASGTLMVRVSR